MRTPTGASTRGRPLTWLRREAWAHLTHLHEWEEDPGERGEYGGGWISWPCWTCVKCCAMVSPRKPSQTMAVEPPTSVALKEVNEGYARVD